MTRGVMLFFTKVVCSLLLMHLTHPVKASEKKPQTYPKKFSILIALHWEGESIKEASIRSLEKFRKEFSQVKIVHLLNPAYLLRSEQEKKKAMKALQRVVMDHDMFGLHLNGWKSLIDEADVDFRFQPTFWGNEIGKRQCSIDCGHEVAIFTYKSNELLEIVESAKETLEKAGFENLNFFHAAGWLGTPRILQVAEEAGFIYSLSEFSNSDSRLSLNNYPLGHWLRKFDRIRKNRDRNKKVALKSFPNHLGYISYSTPTIALEQFKEFLQNSKKDQPIWVLSMAQENAFADSPLLTKIIWDIHKFARSNSLQSSFFEIGQPEDNPSLFDKPLEGSALPKNQPEVAAKEESKNPLEKLAKDFYQKMLRYTH